MKITKIDHHMTNIKKNVVVFAIIAIILSFVGYMFNIITLIVLAIVPTLLCLLFIWAIVNHQNIRKYEQKKQEGA